MSCEDQPLDPVMNIVDRASCLRVISEISKWNIVTVVWGLIIHELILEAIAFCASEDLSYLYVDKEWYAVVPTFSVLWKGALFSEGPE